MEKDIVCGLEKSILLRCQFAKLNPCIQCSPNQIPAGCFGRNRPQLILKFVGMQGPRRARTVWKRTSYRASKGWEDTGLCIDQARGRRDCSLSGTEKVQE